MYLQSRLGLAPIEEVTQKNYSDQQNRRVEMKRSLSGNSKVRGSAVCSLSDFGLAGRFSLSLGAWVPKNLARRS
jgi:hypothetical protein